MLQVPLAYKYVMTAAMIAFVNHYAPRLNMPFDVPLKEQEIQRLVVKPPECDNMLTVYGGGIRVSNYSFGFSDGFINSRWSHFTGYFVITKLEDDGMTAFGIPLLKPNEGANSLMERASRIKYTVNTNDLYRMATNYLVALEIDQKAFEKKNPLKVEQGVYHSNRGLVPSPLMCAYWGTPQLRDPGSNGFAFEVSAVSGELLELNVGNASTCKGLPLIKDLNKLLAISDEEFLKYSAEERSNLVVRFSNIICPVPTNESHILPSQTNAPAETNFPAKQ
jgi:hypothetical protein